MMLRGNDMVEQQEPEGVVLSPEALKSRRQRNIAIGLAVGFFALLFYAVTIVKLGPGILDRPF
jgi:hypothetical protein